MLCSKTILGHPNYSISSTGIVKNIKTGRVLKYDMGEYKRVTLGKGNRYAVHRLVALHFIPNHDSKPILNHKDGDKYNNNVDNIEWCTHLENSRHAQLHGLMKIRTYPIMNRNKCTQDEASEICEAYATGMFTFSEISKEVGISISRVSQYINNKWSMA